MELKTAITTEAPKCCEDGYRELLKYWVYKILLRHNGDFPDTDLPDYKATRFTEEVNVF